MAETILGISPGTRIIGLAVIRNGELIDYQVKSFKEAWSKEKMEMIIIAVLKLCDYYRVSKVAFRGIHPLITSPQLHDLSRGIIDRLKRRQIKVKKYTLKDLKAYCRGTGDEKRGVMEYINETYPELKKHYLQERNSFYPYYIKMFEAIIASKLADVQLRRMY